MQHKLINTGDYLLIVDESKINQDDYIYRLSNKELEKANDEWLDDTHDDWKKIIAHLPLNNSPILEGVDLLPPLEDDIIGKPLDNYIRERHNQDECVGFIDGYNKAKEKYKYTEEDVMKAYDFGSNALLGVSKNSLIQSLQQPKMPVGFECEMLQKKPKHTDYGVLISFDNEPFTVVNTQGLTQWVGEYIY
jgi:hypothetical protein